MIEERIHTRVGNYYGEIEFTIREGKYYIELENWNGIDMKEISKEFYELAKKEFKNENV